MPPLDHPRQEAVARAWAKDARLDDACEDAGFVLCKRHPSRLARRPEVAERIAELRGLRSEAEDISPQRPIPGLLRMAKAAEASENAALVKEARLALLDAARLHGVAESERQTDQLHIIDEYGAEARAAAKAPMR